LKTNATNEDYRAVASNPVNPQRPVLFVNSPMNWVQWWRLPMLYEVLPRIASAQLLDERFAAESARLTAQWMTLNKERKEMRV
jgi:hypothetical protein